MSLDGLRDAYIREKTNEIASCEQSRKRKLRELYSVNALLSADSPQQLQDCFRDELTECERAFLEACDITKGFRFNDSSLPYPIQHAHLPATLPFHAPVKPNFPALAKSSPSLSPVNVPMSIAEQLRAASASPSVATPPEPAVVPSIPGSATPAGQPSPPRSPPVDAPAQAGSQLTADVDQEDAAEKAAIGSNVNVKEVPSAQPSDAPPVQQEERPARAMADGPSADPLVVIPPTSEDDAALEAIAPGLPNGSSAATSEPKAPQVVHLPGREEQEARLAKTERKLEKARDSARKEDETLAKAKPAVSTSTAPVDALSSPTSTMGAYSQATPHAPQQSPDTSPDRESFVDQAAPPLSTAAEMEMDPSARQAKEEHERALQQQMEEAREQARAESSSTIEVERQLEEEQAIRLARDGKSRLGESELVTAAHTLTDQAEDVVSEVAAADADEAKASQKPAADSLPTPTTVTAEPSVSDIRATKEASKPEETASAGAEHPTPPAEVDVEMVDLPTMGEAKDPAPPRHRSPRPAAEGGSEETQQESVPEIDINRAASKAMLTPHSSNTSATSLSSAISPSRGGKRKEASTVVFVKHDAQKYSKELQLMNADYASLQGAHEDPSRDYLIGLFQFQAHHPPRSQPLTELVNSAKKTLSTAGTLAMYRESCDYKILKRLYHLQNANRWAHRQLQKSAEPPRPISHLDHLLANMKWMRTDFKQHLSWRKQAAANYARRCAEYVNSTPEKQASLRVRARIPPNVRRPSIFDTDMNDAPTPDLVHSGAHETESESFADDEEFSARLISNPPAGVFSLGFEDIVMKIDRTPAGDAMLAELPEYDPVLEGSNDITPRSFFDPPILPVSKFTKGKLISKTKSTPRKRSRYEFESEDESANPPSRSSTFADQSLPSTPGRRLYNRNNLEPEMTSVALFDLEYKHMRERLHSAHQFKPPTEFPMPPVSFFENRSSSQWLWDEDQKLRALVKEYSFNWSLVSQQLSLPSKFVSGAGRRTPWECFERWMGLEGLPADMGKTQYFKTYSNRLDQAARTVNAQHQQLLQQQASQGQSVTASQARGRTNRPVRVERRRENRHLAMIDAMRKLARKREQNLHKQAETQKAALLRKAHEPAAANKSNVHTPQEFSRLKWEKEEKRKQMQLQEAQLRQSYQQRALMQQQQQAMQGQPGMPNNAMAQQRSTGAPGNNPNVPAQMANSAPQPGHLGANPSMTPRPHPVQQAMQASFPNTNLSGMAMNSPGVPQAQMQASMQGNQRMAPPDSVRMAMQRAQYPAGNQHQFALQQQQMNMAGNLTANMAMGNGMSNANMMGSMVGQNMAGNMNSPMNGSTNNASSPRLNQVNPQMQGNARPLSSGHMPQFHQIQNTIKREHPEWSQEQIAKQASTILQNYMQKQRLQATSAAAGPGMTPSGMSQSGMSPSPQIGNNVYLPNGGMQNSPSPNPVGSYSSQLMQQQQRLMNQQGRQGSAAASPGMSARPMSRSATPQNPQLGIQSPNAVPGAVGTMPQPPRS